MKTYWNYKKFNRLPNSYKSTKLNLKNIYEDWKKLYEIIECEPTEQRLGESLKSLHEISRKHAA